jgi:hypothetical protein
MWIKTTSTNCVPEMVLRLRVMILRMCYRTWTLLRQSCFKTSKRTKSLPSCTRYEPASKQVPSRVELSALHCIALHLIRSRCELDVDSSAVFVASSQGRGRVASTTQVRKDRLDTVVRVATNLLQRHYQGPIARDAAPKVSGIVQDHRRTIKQQHHHHHHHPPPPCE